MKWVFVLLFSVFCFNVSVRRVAAVTVSHTAIPDQVIDSLDYQVTVTVGVEGTVIGYLRPVFRKGTGSYFGCVKTNCDTYYCDSDVTKYPSLLGSGSKTFSIRVDSGFSGLTDDDYEFKVRRCTSANSCTDSSVQTVHITKNISSPVPLVKDDTCPFPTPTPIPPTPTPTPTLSPTSTPTPTATPTPTPVPQPGNISLSEVMACPSGGSEWVELYNGNDNSVILSNWKFQDNKNTSMTITDSDISAKGHKAFDISGLNYNNSGDTVRLLDGNGNLVESFSYSSCSSSQTYAKNSSGNWQQTLIITKGEANRFPTPIPSASPTATPTPSPTASPTPDPSVLGESTDSGIPNLVVSQETADEVATKSANRQKESPLFAILAIVLGLVSLATLGGYLWYDWKKKQSGNPISQ